MPFTLHCGDCLEVVSTFEENSIDAIVTDPPYGLSFMGKNWDHGVPGQHFWEEFLRVAKPGAFLLAFGGTRTFHRLAVAIEDAGWELRDTLMWTYGTGFPKSMDVSKAIDKELGAERTKVVGTKLGRPGMAKDGSNQSFDSSINTYGGGGTLNTAILAPATPEAQQWEGFGTALKPAWEPIILARKKPEGTVAKNAMKYGVGGLNIDGCRVGNEKRSYRLVGTSDGGVTGKGPAGTLDGRDPEKIAKRFEVVKKLPPKEVEGRWPANLIHDGSDEVLSLFPTSKDGIAVNRNRGKRKKSTVNYANHDGIDKGYGGEGSAARFFYCPKASKQDRGADNKHPTVKPFELMKYLIRLVTPLGGTVLDPFMGSGSTGKAAVAEQCSFVGVDLEKEYVALSQKRITQQLKQQ